MDKIKKILNNPKFQKTLLLIFILITIILSVRLIGKISNNKKQNENLGKIEEKKIESKDNTIKVKPNKFNPMNEDSMKKEEGTFYRDKYNLLYKRTNIPSLGISTMVPYKWEISFDNPGFIYIRSKDPNYRATEIALCSNMKADVNDPSKLADEMYQKIFSRFEYHIQDYTMIPDQNLFTVHPIDAYYLGDRKNPVYVSYDPENGYVEYPLNKKPKSREIKEKNIKFLAYSYDSWMEFVGVIDKDLTGQMHTSHRYMSVGDSGLNQFIGVTGAINNGAKLIEIANTMVSFAEPYKKEKYSVPDLANFVRFGKLSVRLPKECQENLKITDHRLYTINDFESIGSGVNIALFKVDFPTIAVKTTDPREFEYIDGIVRSLSTQNETTFEAAQQLDPDNIFLTHGKSERINNYITKYPNTMLFLKHKESISGYTFHVDFPLSGNLYIIDLGDNKSSTYAMFIDKNKVNSEFVDDLGDFIAKNINF